MSAQSCFPHDPWPYPGQIHYPSYGWPTYGTGTATLGFPITEERIREIIREELKAALQPKESS